MRRFSVPDESRIMHRLVVVLCVGWSLLANWISQQAIVNFHQLRGRCGRHTISSLFFRWPEKEVKSMLCIGSFSKQGTSSGTENMRRLYQQMRRSFRVTTPRTCRKKSPTLSSGLLQMVPYPIVFRFVSSVSDRFGGGSRHQRR